MNLIFFLMISIAFAAAFWQQIFWRPPTPEELEAMRMAAEASGQPAPEVLSPMQSLTAGALTGAATAVEIAIGLIGGMALFLGVMKVAEAGGMLRIVARLIRPIMIRLFPDVPPEHPAMGAMILNLSANALGLGNAATPFGLRAMQELDKLNAQKGTATNAMALFLAINTSSVTLLPTGVIVIRERLGSHDPGGIFATTLIATACSTLTAIAATKLYQRFASPDPGARGPVEAASPDVEAIEDHGAYPGWVSALAMLGLVGFVVFVVFYGRAIAPWVIPCILFGMLAFGWARGVRVYETLVEGAKDGFRIGTMIIPYLVAILVAVKMLEASGALDFTMAALGPFTGAVGLPAEALPMAIMRPLSGSGASAVMIATMEKYGTDSYVGYLVSTLQGSTETTFYVLAVYFGAVQVQRMRHTVAAALTGELAGIAGAVAACTWLYQAS